MKDNPFSSYRITIETPFTDTVESLAIKMENSFNKFKRNIRSAIDETNLISNEFENQGDFPNYIPNDYIRSCSHFNGVWIQTEYIRMDLSEISKEENAEHFNVSILTDKIETDMVSLEYDDANLKNVTLKDGVQRIKELLKKIDEACFLDSVTYFKMDISK